ncbi:IclR family transcriptional regulator [Cryptosporangium arvum]|uniref:Glycerol operon regulatory protein n=1 Tax=Cryptosporangium arvum DSM 44712 TaxID=927661 RepID=A0A010ZQW1_9ACTN|nr:IclR family transcriptional regulator [Cryptosporangium arvum]EXG81064.1 transcriptional regulator [Cryptosporangium arvum DSM 44712]
MAEVPAAANVLAILRYFARQAGPVGAAAIARDLRLPRSTTYHLLATLADAGFVVHLPEERRYALGVSAYELGTGYTRQAPLQRLARVPLATLVDRLGQSAHLAVLHGREVIYVIEERAPGRPPLVTDVGVRLPAQLTASGRAMLAVLPKPAVRALFPDAGAFVRRHELGPTNYAELRRLLTAVTKAGYATEDGEVTPGFASVAAPVTDHSGHPVAAVAVTFPVAEGDPDALADAVRRTAAEIARRVGGTPPG